MYTILVFLDLPIIFENIFLKALLIASMFSTDESLIAFQDRKSPVGSST